MDTNTGESPGHQSLSQRLGNSPSEEEMGHWTPMGVEPKDYDDDDDDFYSTSSSPLLLRGAPDTAQILCRSFTPTRHLPKGPPGQLVRDSNPRPLRQKATNLPMSHHDLPLL